MTPIAIKELKTARDVPDSCRPPAWMQAKHLVRPNYSIYYGSCYLDLMLARYNDWPRALIAYNGGGYQVNRYDKGLTVAAESGTYVVRVIDKVRRCKQAIKELNK